MLCCVGLIGGLYVGQSLGGHWVITAPAVGFGLGLYGDMKFMHGMHGRFGAGAHHDDSKMPGSDTAPKQVKAGNQALRGSDINMKEVQRDSS